MEREEVLKRSLRHIAGTGYEITAGIGWDAVTAKTAIAPPLYAALNYGEGALSNIIGQLIRGEKFNWKEVHSSGVLGIVPLSQLRAAKYLNRPAAEAVENVVGKVGSGKRLITSGAVTGVADQTIQAGLDNRLPTTEEIVGGALIGGAVGGGIKGTAVLGRKVRDQIAGTYEGFTSGLGGASIKDTSGSDFHRFKVSDLMSSNALLRYINQKGDPKPIQDILTRMDNWRVGKDPSTRPMTGFTRAYRDLTGKNPTFVVDDIEYGIGWSRKKNTYEIFDVQKRIESRRSRFETDLTSNVREKEKRSIIEAVRRDMNLKSRTLNPDQWDLLIQNPGSAYVEHLIAVKSPFWKSFRGRNVGYKPGDVRNLKIIGDENFKKLKDNVEKYVHKNYPELYVDYDPLTHNLILRNLETGKALPNQIPGYGKFRLAKEYTEDAIAGIEMKAIEDVYGPTDSPPPNIARQIDSAYFNNLTEFEKDIIVARIEGATWPQIKQKFGKKLDTKQLTLLKKGYNQLSQKEITAIMTAYRKSGKGGTPL